MKIVYALDPMPDQVVASLFLAGPSPRRADHLNWRPEALNLLERLGFEGTVFIPLLADGTFTPDYQAQITWERQAMERADQIVFWVPRGDTLPGFTTNVEFGIFYATGRVVLGFPPKAPSTRYLAALAETEQVPVHDTLEGTLAAAIDRIGAGSERVGGECAVPLTIWQTPAFQSWYRSQRAAGNRLDGARVLWTFQVGPQRAFTFAFALRVDVHVASEKRNKTNEFILARPDIAALIGYRPAPTLLDTEVVLVREFRSPVRNAGGFIREVPGGSSWNPGEDPQAVMVAELQDETGLGAANGFPIDPTRLRIVGSRQLCGTFSTHHAQVFACKLTHTEMDFLRRQQAQNQAHGVAADSERTYVEVHRLGDLLAAGSDAVDWATLGQLLTALLQPHENGPSPPAAAR